ncbi:MAG: molybdopterin molybdotransferase MoeA [Sandarakinorhabdus sp.]|jgi:molybdopterin molybdotransferase|nr:molybdopterin molybdotransferase MoeA [Sandarakinorhabdus sp.]
MNMALSPPLVAKAGLVDFADAIALIEAAVVPLGIERVPIAAAAGRVLAEPLFARCDRPAAPVSAMDGYAVAAASLAPGAVLPVIGEARAGAGFAGMLQPGQAVRIFTGAPLPCGADRVVMQEDTTRDGDHVRIADAIGSARHIRAAASDFAAGALLLKAGTRLHAPAMVAAAAADMAHLHVHRRPRVAIIATGDEIVPPGQAHRRAESIPDSASHGAAAMAVCAGASIVRRAQGRDNLALLTAQAREALALAELVIVTGGASVGDHDLARPMFAAHGLELLFAKVAIKPGKPVWLGRARGRWVLGLPGNPTAALVTAALFLRPLLARLQGQATSAVLRWQRLPLAAPLPATGCRETFVRASGEADGLVPLAQQDSSAQAALARADWLIRCPPGQPALPAGTLVSALAF